MLHQHIFHSKKTAFGMLFLTPPPRQVRIIRTVLSRQTQCVWSMRCNLVTSTGNNSKADMSMWCSCLRDQEPACPGLVIIGSGCQSLIQADVIELSTTFLIYRITFWEQIGEKLRYFPESWRDYHCNGLTNIAVVCSNECFPWGCVLWRRKYFAPYHLPC